MYRIRFHGRGGQGIKTAGRILGSAFFLAGFEVQDAPRYGAERRGAPLFAYVRADRRPIWERGIIRRPDLVAVADDTLVSLPAAGVLAGVAPPTVLLLGSSTPAAVWRERLRPPGLLLTLPLGEVWEPATLWFVGATLAGAAARLVGVIPREALERALREELAGLGPEVVEENLARALSAYDLLAEHAGCVTEGPELTAEDYERPHWVDLAPEEADLAAPAIHAPATSEAVPTGLWRTLRPVVDRSRCRRCAWICSTLCPDGTIGVDAQGFPVIDYRHCKGCLVCASSCPAHAIQVMPERQAAGE